MCVEEAAKEELNKKYIKKKKESRSDFLNSFAFRFHS